MKKFTLLLVAFTLVLGLSSIARAETVGFEFGVNYLAMAGDNRFDGTSNSFALTFPLDKGFSASIYHESGSLSGTDTTAAGVKLNATLNMDINEIRLKKEIVSTGGVPIGLVLGLGHASVTNAFNADAPVADVGVKVVPLTTKGKNMDTTISIDLMYRFLKIPATNAAFAAPLDPVDDLGGFAIGLNVGAMF